MAPLAISRSSDLAGLRYDREGERRGVFEAVPRFPLCLTYFSMQA
jgi:hypothetical protein